MAKSSWETKEEKDQMIAELKQLESTFAHSTLDWKKIKAQSADALAVTLSIIKRQVNKGLIELKPVAEKKEVDKTQLDYILDYCDLGYDFSPTMLYGKEAVRMVKRYSHKAERKLMCEQIFHHDELKNMDRLLIILDFMYQDIQQQEKSGEYYESSDYNIESN